MRLVKSLASAAQPVLALACWLAPGPRCPRILGAVLGAVAVAGILGALLYGLWS
jgi:hypothetical protein